MRPSEQLSWVEVSSDWAAMAAFFVPEVFNVKTTSKAAPSKGELRKKDGVGSAPADPPACKIELCEVLQMFCKECFPSVNFDL
ncbi:hypothetical protein ACTT2I_10505 [Stenotrophomonas sp. PUT21]|uniref:hypothetical protein n=1 Tax=Stenotrophomonas sp. PUT21 TaxID=3456954 RepID=UPI003FCC534F